MKEYWKSDYALNKRSPSIVYQFATGLVEITLEDYIRENPDKTAEDFLALKAISDGIYHEQFSRLKAQTRRELPLFGFAHVSTPSAEQDMERKLKLHALEDLWVRLERFLESGLLTEVQKRRFYRYCIRDLSTRQIARIEGVSQCSVWECLHACEKKFEKFLGRYPVTPPEKR